MPRAAPMLRSSKDDLSSSVLSHVSSHACPLCWPSWVLLPFAFVSALRDDSACAEEAILLLSSASSASISRSSRLCLRLRLRGAGLAALRAADGVISLAASHLH